MQIDYTSRQEKLRGLVGADAIILVPGTNMVYFTGLHFHLSERPILAVFSGGGLSFVIPELEMPKIRERHDIEARAFIWDDEHGYAGAFKRLVAELGLKKAVLGLDGMTMRVFEHLALQTAGTAGLVVDAGQALQKIRAIKTPDEIDAMRQATRISETALRKVIDWVEPGMTEVAIARRLADELAAAGSEGHAFDPLILVGERSALPHGNPGQRALGRDEFLLIDYGGTYNGYPADITRTFCLGTPTADMRKIYDIVLRANEAAKKATGPGVTCGAVDRAARDVITQAGYGSYFFHRTGHGLGLDVHELPQIAAGVEMPLEPGMVFTIEPGIYLPELGGVRIEDNVVVTESGLDVLTTYPRQLAP